VYVDGFNLYYRALKRPRAPDGTTYKWLDLAALAQQLLRPPKYTINRIRYFTAEVRGHIGDPQAPLHQQMYLRALRTIPNLSIHLGHFMVKKTKMPLVHPLPDGTDRVLVTKTEEKGSDVNVAAHLLLDAFRGDFEAAAVVTNDSDLAEPIRIVRDELKLPISVLDPCGDSRTSRELTRVSTFYKPIRLGPISVSLFPEEMTDAVGTFRKPLGW
jgi:hypothetical protein